jgi:hypothetical protein
MLTRLSDRLARRPGGPVAWLVALLSLALPTAALALDVPRPIWTADTLPVVPTVVRVYRDGTRDLSACLRHPRGGRWTFFDPADQTPYCVRPAADGTGRYSSYPAGMEVFAWPAVLAADAAGWDLGDDWVLFAVEQRAAAAAAGLCVALLFLAALRVGSPAAAWVTAALVATGSVVPSVLSQLLWQQTGVAFWSLVVLLVELGARGRPGAGGTLLQGVACALMLACRPSAVTFLVPFGLWVLARDRRRGVLLPLAALVAYLPWAAVYWSIYRTPFGPSMAFLDQTWTPAANVLGVLFSPGRGLFVYQPWVWLLPLLLARSVRTDQARPLPPGWYGFCFAAVACHVALVGSWGVWWGGYSWGSRLAAEVVPVAGLLAVRPVGWLLRRWWGWLPLALVAAAGVAVHAVHTHGPASGWNSHADVDKHPEKLWDWRDPPFLYRGR